MQFCMQSIIARLPEFVQFAGIDNFHRAFVRQSLREHKQIDTPFIEL